MRDSISLSCKRLLLKRKGLKPIVVLYVEIDALSVDAMRTTLEAELSNLLSLDVIEQVREQSVEVIAS